MDEGFVTVTPVGDRSADVRICSPDATGFGCDLARTMFDFGLVVERGDFSTDGKWSFLMFKVRAASASPQRLPFRRRSRARTHAVALFRRLCLTALPRTARTAGASGKRPRQLPVGSPQAAARRRLPHRPLHLTAGSSLPHERCAAAALHLSGALPAPVVPHGALTPHGARQVEVTDRVGLLHDVTQALWERELTGAFAFDEVSWST